MRYFLLFLMILMTAAAGHAQDAAQHPGQNAAAGTIDALKEEDQQIEIINKSEEYPQNNNKQDPKNTPPSPGNYPIEKSDAAKSQQPPAPIMNPPVNPAVNPNLPFQIKQHTNTDLKKRGKKNNNIRLRRDPTGVRSRLQRHRPSMGRGRGGPGRGGGPGPPRP